MRSSTSRNCPAFSLTAATVMAGFHAMRDTTAGGAAPEPPCSATPGGAQTVLRGDRVPDCVELSQIELGDWRIVEVGYAVPRIRAHSIRDRAIVGDQVGRGALRGFSRDVADVYA